MSFLTKLMKGGGGLSGITDQIKSTVASTPKITSNKIIGAGLYYYYFYLGPGSKTGTYKPNNEGAVGTNAEGQKNAEIILFYVDWCPHCKTAKPEWDATKAQYDGTTKNGYKIVFTEINCTNENAQNEQMIKQYKVEGYPTIKLLKDGKVIDFDAKPTQNSLGQLISTSV